MIGGPLCIGSSSRGRCNIDGVGRCRADRMCSLRRRSGDRDSCKVSFILVSLMMPVIMLPCVSALVAGSFMTFGSFGSIAVVNCVTNGRCKTGPYSLSVWQCTAVHHCAEEFVHCSCAVVAAVAEAWEHETRRRKGSDHAYFGLEDGLVQRADESLKWRFSSTLSLGIIPQRPKYSGDGTQNSSLKKTQHMSVL